MRHLRRSVRSHSVRLIRRRSAPSVPTGANRVAIQNPLLDDAILRSSASLRLRPVRDAAGEIAKVSQTFQPSGRCEAGELAVAFKVHVALIAVADFEDVADLRSDAQDARLEAAERVARSAVAGELW